MRRLIEVQLPLAADDIDEWSVWIQFWNQAMLEPLLRPAQRRIYSGWYRVVVDVLHECRSEGLAPEADIEALADRFTAMVDGLAIQILANSTDMQPDRMRALLLHAFEPHLDLTDQL
ncbi:TetR family transcriptional regulator C-terminal domain-containing protein [Streptomyces sp. NBC_01478]|uniref:TetR family transcriptional regulator C-terminal domain-containing protein n=1 Tax=Streptomyces sp. NBC_01478 TaxID=2903882 RepID=UPI002E36F01D|nr:TetR family transcriptional regulator C-terminal domain-containing protein [Streptomyces sp. NBC_01478]